MRLLLKSLVAFAAIVALSQSVAATPLTEISGHDPGHVQFPVSEAAAAFRPRSADQKSLTIDNYYIHDLLNQKGLDIRASLQAPQYAQQADDLLVVPFMEELFWRDFCWRSIIAPNDFKLAKVGEWDWKAFVAIPIIFSFVHLPWWPTAIVWAFMIGALLVVTRSLGACIIAHATTNLLLGVYVLYSKQWSLW